MMRDDEFDCDVLIAGAGPVGLTLALALERAGVDFRIVDQAQGFSGASKAITVQPRILEQLHVLGAAAPLVAAGVRTFVMHMHDQRKRLTTLRYDRLPTPFPFYLHLHQGQTERLLAGLLGERGVEIERGLALTEFEVREPDAGVEVVLRTSTGGDQRLRCRYLVGCDGGHSRVRAGLRVDFSGERHGDNWIMGDLKIAGFDLAPDQRHGFMLENYPFVILPMSDGYHRVIAARSPGSPLVGQDPTLDEFAAIAARLGFASWRFEQPLWLTNYNPSQFIASRFRRGPVFLAGDAAHVNTPIGAQGLNTGVMDATNLAWKLSWALRHGASARLLDSYHDERHPIVLAMFRDNDRLTRMVFGHNPIVRKLIRTQLRLLELAPFNLRNTSNSAQLSVRYPHSPLLLPEPRDHWASLRARLDRTLACGDRVPCPRLHGPRPGAETLYDLLTSTHHTLLVFDDARGTASDWAARVAAARGDWLRVLCFVPRTHVDASPSVHADPQRSIAAAFGVESGGAVLVRPDAFVAARVELGADAVLERYLALLNTTNAR